MIIKKIKDPYEITIFGKGYFGEGIYKSYDNGKVSKEYTIWYDMLKRCYNPKCHERYPTYIGCEVCDEWLNFQNFAKWHNENYYEIPGERTALDKDILVKGNKIYSPNTCIYVPQNINSLFTRRNVDRGEFPIGVTFDKRRNKYKAYCHVNSTMKTLGRYNTPEEAFMAYKTFKEKRIKELADEYIELVPEVLYNAMYNYEINYND